TEKPEIEVVCKVYNINPNYNQGLKERSAVLEGYTYFVEKVREYQKQNRNVEEAVDTAIEDCIREHILEDFFRTRKDEVKKMTHLDYTWEQREKLIRKEEYEQGLERGMEKGTYLVAENMLLANKPLEEIMAFTGISIEKLKGLATGLKGE
ncbi:MAG: hypothetical protein ACI4HQ_10945, partial [Acetatifactor sp.]